MTPTITVQDYERAEREIVQAEAQSGFRIHVAAYVLVNLLLVAINLGVIRLTTQDTIWFVFPLVGWSVGLAMHYIFGALRLETEITERQARIEQRAAQV